MASPALLGVTEGGLMLTQAACQWRKKIPSVVAPRQMKFRLTRWKQDFNARKEKNHENHRVKSGKQNDGAAAAKRNVIF